MSTTVFALVGFTAWYLLLNVGLAVFRLRLIASGVKAPNSFATDGADLPGLGRRLTRARDNCFETLPVFVALAFAANASGRLDVTDGLAMWVLFARLGQSVTHILSVSVNAVRLRAALFFAQVTIYIWWAIQLLA